MIAVLLPIGIMGFMDLTSPKQAIGAEAKFETILKDGFYGGLGRCSGWNCNPGFYRRPNRWSN